MKKVFLHGIFSALAYVFFGIIFNGDHLMMIVFLLSAIFFYTIFYFREEKDIYLLSKIFLLNSPVLILLVVATLITKDLSRVLQYLIFIPISNFISFYYLRSRKKIIIPLALILFYIIGFYIYNNMFILISNSGAEKKTPFPNVTLLDKNRKEVELDKDKIIVLDFWSTSCGICFEKFPDLQETYLKYKNNDLVEIYAVNFPLKRDKFEKTKRILDSLEYDFFKIYAKSAREIEDSLKVNTFPHLIILKNGEIRFDGVFETKKNSIFYNVEYQIDKLLNE